MMVVLSLQAEFGIFSGVGLDGISLKGKGVISFFGERALAH